MTYYIGEVKPVNRKTPLTGRSIVEYVAQIYHSEGPDWLSHGTIESQSGKKDAAWLVYSESGHCQMVFPAIEDASIGLMLYTGKIKELHKHEDGLLERVRSHKNRQKEQRNKEVPDLSEAVQDNLF